MRATVVVPVRADPDGLASTLDALAGTRVVVVVDGPDAATEAVARQAGATVVVLDRPRGSYAARNAGIEAVPADTDAVLFTDAGCVPGPGWVAAHLAVLQHAELSGGAVDVVHGYRPTPAEWVDRCRNLRQQSYVEDAGFAATCNLGVRRSVLDAVRFDDRLQSGGDRDFCLRATAAGAQLVYAPAAVVAHPARRTSAAVLAKARRIGRGIAAMPAASRPPLPRVQRPSRALARRARAAGVRTTPLWTARVALLDHRRARAMDREARRPAPVAGLHVVVLLASRWAALETMNTRWRQVIQAWTEHPDVAKVTVVDHPWFRRRAIEPLARQGISWLPSVDLIDLTVPTTLRPGPLDRLAWWRAARSLRRALPPCEQRLVVATSAISTPILRHLRGLAVTTAFDAVDPWRNLALTGDLGLRHRSGFRAVADADRLTAVSGTIAEALQQWSRVPARVVPNGVDLLAYSDHPPAPAGLPDEQFATYVGSLSSRLDLDLVDAVARQLPDVPVVLAGPADDATAARLATGPCHWLGPVSPDEVPGLLRRAAVGLFPQQPTDLTQALDSMKLLEYGAAGLPVVSTPVPGLPDGVVAAVGAEQFAAAVRVAATMPRDTRPAAWVQSRDWTEVASRLLRAMRDEERDPVLETQR